MGLLDLITSKIAADVAHHKASAAERQAKIRSLETLSAVADLLQTQIQGTPGTPGKMEFPNQENVPAVSESTDLFNGSIRPNPSLAPVMVGGTPGTPGQTLGNPLLDAIVPTLIRSGDLGNTIKVVEHLTDPMRKMKEGIISGLNGQVNMQPGASAQPSGQSVMPPEGTAQPPLDMFAGIIQGAANGDPAALSTATKLKVLGFDLAPFIERMQKSDEPIKRQIYDPTTGQTYEAMYKKHGAIEIPRTRNLIKPDEVQWVDEALPGGGTQKVPYRGRTRLELLPTASPLPPQGANAQGGVSSPVQNAPGSNLPPFQASFPPGTDVGPVINKIVSAASGKGGVITKYPETEMPIPSEQIGNWFNQKFENPPIGTSPAEAERMGFKSHTANGANIMGKTKQAVGIINQLEGLSKELFPESGLFNRVGAGAKAGYNLVTQDNPNYAIYSKLSQSVLGPLIRQLGEAGALSDGDVQRAFNIMGKLFPFPDSKTVALQSWQEIRKIVLQGTKFVEGASIKEEQGRPSLLLGKDGNASAGNSGQVIKWTRDASGKLVRQ
jgi:hypothetical protein